MFDDELRIVSPFDRSEHGNLVTGIAAASWARAVLRDGVGTMDGTAIFPEAGGLLFWGTDGGGADYFWDTAPADPNQWTVVVTGRPVGPTPERHPHPLTEYLARLADGSVPAAGLGDWPGPNPTIRRMR